MSRLLFVEIKSKKWSLEAEWLIAAGAYPGFCSMKGLGVFLLPPGWDASPSQGYPGIKFAGTHLSTQVYK